MLQVPLRAVIDKADMEAGLAKFSEYCHAEYRSLMLKKLGFEQLDTPEADELLSLTIKFLQESQVGYHQFFYELARTFSVKWRDEPGLVLSSSDIVPPSGTDSNFDNLCVLYHKILNDFDIEQMNVIARNLAYYNPKTALLRPVIEEVWEPIIQEDNWQPFYDLVKTIQSRG
jgi:uncharacterized protein YdiU (UPF0061 family)